MVQTSKGRMDRRSQYISGGPIRCAANSISARGPISVFPVSFVGSPDRISNYAGVGLRLRTPFHPHPPPPLPPKNHPVEAPIRPVAPSGRGLGASHPPARCFDDTALIYNSCVLESSMISSVGNPSHFFFLYGPHSKL